MPEVKLVSNDYFMSLGKEILIICDTLFHYTGNFIAYLSAVFLVLFGTYAAAIVFEYYHRGFDEVVMDLGKKLLLWLFLFALTMNPDNYNYLVHFLFNLPEKMTDAIVHGSEKMLNLNYFEQAMVPIEVLIEKIEFYYQTLGWSQIGELIKTLLLKYTVAIIGDLYVTIGFVFYMVAKLSFALVLLVGPFYLFCLIFPAVRQWGMNWIGQVVSFIFLIMFYLLISVVFIDYLVQITNKLLDSQITFMNMDLAEVFLFKLIVAFVMFLVVLIKLPSIVSGLTGGASLEGGISTATRSLMALKTGGISAMSNANKMGQMSGPLSRFGNLAKNTIKPGGK